MALMWGWGPFAIKPEGHEVAAGERARDALRKHKGAAFGTEEFIEAAQTMTEAIAEVWTVVGKRFQLRGDLPAAAATTVVPFSGPGFAIVEKRHERLVEDVMKATLVASLVNIEYEFKSAEIGPAKVPTKAEGPAHWWVQGQATETNTHRTMPGFGASEDFDLTNPHAVEAEFLVATARAYVDAINAIAPFRGPN